jgi:hypothetical protein
MVITYVLVVPAKISENKKIMCTILVKDANNARYQ